MTLVFICERKRIYNVNLFKKYIKLSFKLIPNFFSTKFTMTLLNT